MSSFDYHYQSSSKYDGSDVIDTLRSSSDSTKAEAIDWLIDNGFLHSDEQYNAAYVLALGDALGIRDEDEEDWFRTGNWEGHAEEDDDKPVGNPKRLGKGVDWRPHEDNFLPSQHDRMRAEATVSSIYIVIDGYTQPIIWFGMTEEDMKIKLIEIIYGDNRFRYVSRGQLDERNEYDRKYGANAEKVTLEELVDEFNKLPPHQSGMGTITMKIEEYDPNDFYHDPTDKYPNAKVEHGIYLDWEAEYARGYTYERPLFMKVAGIGLLTAFALGLLRMDSKGDTTSNE